MKFELDDFEKLITEYREQRLKLNEMIAFLDLCDEKIEEIFKKTSDNRYSGLISEKFKSVAEIYKVKLDVRKEISKNIKDEIEMRRKIEIEDGDDSIGGISHDVIEAAMRKAEEMRPKLRKVVDNGLDLVEIDLSEKKEY